MPDTRGKMDKMEIDFTRGQHGYINDININNDCNSISLLVNVQVIIHKKTHCFTICNIIIDPSTPDIKQKGN